MVFYRPRRKEDLPQNLGLFLEVAADRKKTGLSRVLEGYTLKALEIMHDGQLHVGEP